MKKITTPLTSKVIKNLKAGDEVLLSGTIYTARDQAHKKLVGMKKLPKYLKGQIIYYAGPTSKPKNHVIGSCGPTTSSRMDEYAPILYKRGLAATIGKGKRSLKKLYFLASAGLGALAAQHVTGARVIAFKELGPEAIYKLEVKDFPLIVGIDSRGRDVYK